MKFYYKISGQMQGVPLQCVEDDKDITVLNLKEIMRDTFNIDPMTVTVVLQGKPVADATVLTTELLRPSGNVVIALVAAPEAPDVSPELMRTLQTALLMQS
eukprot:PhF_6_TR36681/c0_g1_i1/m.54064